MFLPKHIPAHIGIALLCLSPLSVSAQSPLIIFSEIASYESNDSEHSEWIEIYNRSDDSVDITDWSFIDSSGDKELIHGIAIPEDVSPLIPSGSYAIIAQNRDRFLANYPDVSVQVFDSSWGSLNESGEYIALLDAAGNIVESLTYGVARDHSLERVNLASDDSSPDNWVELDGHTAGFAFVPYTETAPPEDAGSVSDSSQNEEENPTEDPDVPSDANEEEQPALETTEDDADDSVDQDVADQQIATDTSQTQSDNDTELSADKRARTTTRGWGAVRINEFVSDPTEYDNEWVEIVNMINEELDISGWNLTDGSGRLHTLNGVLPIHGYAVFDNLKFKLNNGGDELRLQDQWGFVIDRMSYGNWMDDVADDNAPVAGKSESLARRVDGVSSGSDAMDFAPTITPTRGFANRVTTRPEPIKQIEPTATNSGTSHASTDTSGGSSIDNESSVHITSTVHTVLLSELMPNPPGPDTEHEFIELYNPSDEDVLLADWRVEDASGSGYTLNSITIRARDYLAIRRSDTGISLNNSRSETVSLLRPDKTESDQVTYEGNVGGGWSFARDGKSWSWTTLTTVGAQNVIAIPNQTPVPTLSVPDEIDVGQELMFDASDSLDPDGTMLQFLWSFGDRTARIYSATSTIRHIYEKPGTYNARVYVSDGFATSSASASILATGDPISTATSHTSSSRTSPHVSANRTLASFRPVALEDIDTLSDGERVITEGTVLVEPGVLGSQVFYIGNPGVEIYMYSKDFPEFRVGDIVRVRGKISTPLDTRRIKIKKREDIVILSTAQSIPTPLPISLLEVEDELVGDVVAVRGEIVSKKNNALVVENDDGEVHVIAKSTAPIDLTQTVGDVVEVAGILTKARSGYRVLPRSNDDVSVIGRSDEEIPSMLNAESRTSHIFLAGSLIPAIAGGAAGLALSALWQQRGALMLTARRPKQLKDDSSKDHTSY